MSKFVDGLKFERREHDVIVSHECGLSVIRHARNGRKPTQEEYDQLEAAAVAALRNLYDHKFRPRLKKGSL